MIQKLHDFLTAKNEAASTSEFGFVKILGYACLLLLSFQQTIQAQTVSADYSFSETTSGAAYSAITGGSVVAGSTADFVNLTNVNVPIGFNFVFNNVSYSSVTISDNGFITFGATSPGTTVTPISAATAYSGAISAYGAALAGLAADGCEIRYETLGSAGSRVFVVQYKNLKRRPIATYIDGLINIQIRLYEADMHIETQWKDFTSTNATSYTGQIGLRGAANTDFLNRTNTAPSGVTTFYPSAAGTLNTSNMPTRQPVAGVYVGPPANVTHIWTPICFNPTALVANLQVDNTTVNFYWNNAAFHTAAFTNYVWEVRSSGTAFSGPGAGYFASGTAASATIGSPMSVTGLLSGVTYTFYVRSNCKPTTVFISGTVTPSCSTPVFPYNETFEGITPPAIPNCTSTAVTTGVAMRTQNNTSTPYYGFANKNLITGSAAAQDTWFFTRLVSLTSGNTYKVSYKYGGSRELAQFTQRMKVAMGATNSAAGMTTVLADHDAIKTSPNTFTFNFVATATGNFYFGFNGYAAATQGYLQIDDISIDVSSCDRPVALTYGSITSNSAMASWTPPGSGSPTGGYEYYYTTSATAPIATTSPIGSTAAGINIVSLTGLASSTTYYFWVRSVCGSDKSPWSNLGTPTFTTTAPPPTPCTPAPTSVDGSGITNITFGTINNTTGAEAGNYGNYSSMITNVAQGATVNMSIRLTTSTFSYYTRVWIDLNNNGSFDDAGENVYFSGTELPPGVNNISFTIPVATALGAHRLRIGAADISTLSGTGTAGPCYTGTWASFEDYSIYVTVPPPPLAVLDENGNTSTSFCSGGTSPKVTITTGASPTFDLYTWTPSNGVTAASGGYYFNPTETTTYTLSAVQTSGAYSTNTATYTVTVNPLPTVINIAPSAPTVCQGAVQSLTASGGIIGDVPIFEENFNGATNTFTLVHNSVGGTPALGYWELHNSPYSIPTGNTDDPMTISSNDVSQFYMSDSDLQGSAGNTNEELISPVIDLTANTDASLSFWHYYKGFSNGSAVVEVSTNGGGSWTALPGATWTTGNQGSPTGFVNVVLSLSAYAYPGNPNNNFRVRFKYASNFGYRWCIDNVKISGSASATVIWSPATDLYTNAGATVPYDGVTPLSTIYCKPSTSSNITYTATATTLAPALCARNQTVTVTVTPFSAGTASGDQTMVCGDTTFASNITLAGYVPNNLSSIVRWEMADEPTFASPTTIAGSANVDVITPAMVGTITLNTYIRAVVTGCRTGYSNTVSIMYPTTTWNGVSWVPAPPTSADQAVVDANLTISSDLNACTLLVKNGRNVTVAAGVTVNVENKVSVLGIGTLVFNNGSSLVQGSSVTTNTNTGNITYKRNVNIRKFDFTYWSSPVYNQNLNSFSNQTLPDKYLTFNSALYIWESAPPLTTPMDAAKGYAIRGPQTYTATPALWTGNFVGVPNNGDYTTNVIKSATGDLNLLGNPYPSAISADAFILGNSSTFDPGSGVGTSLYFWTHNTPLTNNAYSASDYAAYNFSGGVGTGAAAGSGGAAPNGKIGAGQGFMVKGVKLGTFPIVFKNNMRVGGVGSNTQFYRLNGVSSLASLERNRIWLDLTNDQGAFKQTMVGYIENATNNFDNGFDAEVLEVGNPVSFYSIQGNNKLAIQGRALPFNNQDQVVMGYTVPVAGSYKIAMPTADGIFEAGAVAVYLEDLLTHVIHDLRTGDYNFVSEAGNFENRFIVKFNNSALSQSDFNFDNTVVVFKSNNDLHVESSNVLIKDVQIFDVAGREITQKYNINAMKTSFQNLNVANQVLMVQITGVNGEVITKKVIF